MERSPVVVDVDLPVMAVIVVVASFSRYVLYMCLLYIYAQKLIVVEFFFRFLSKLLFERFGFPAVLAPC